MLERNILTGSFAKPDSEQQAMPTTEDPSSLRHAGKIRPEDRLIVWQSWTADDIALRDRVVGRTWANDVSYLHSRPENSRVTFQGWKDATHEFGELSRHHHLISFNPEATDRAFGVPMAFKDDPEKRIFFYAAKSTIASPTLITVEGKPKVNASSFYQNGVDHGARIGGHGNHKK